MRNYIIRRLALFIPTAFGVSLFIFMMLHVIPGDYATSLLLSGTDRTIEVTEEDFERVRKRLGLDGSLPEQYIRWAGNFVRGDFGTSWTNRRPVLDRMRPRLLVSAELAFLAVLIAVVIAIPGGILAAARRDTWVDYVFRVLSIGFESAPNFWLALLTILVLLAVLIYASIFLFSIKKGQEMSENLLINDISRLNPTNVKEIVKDNKIKGLENAILKLQFSTST